MNGYLINFIVYTFAMIGFIAIALFIYKKSLYNASDAKNREFLKIENSLRLSATKTVYVLKAGNEKFLIAGDSANTTMLSKLEDNSFEMTNNEKVTEIPILAKPLQKMKRG